MQFTEKVYNDNIKMIAKIANEYVLVDVFAYNDPALKFYFKQGYHPRMLTTIKKI